MLHALLAGIILCQTSTFQPAAQRKPGPATGQPILLKPEAVFDGISRERHIGWVVLVNGETITAAGPAEQVNAPANARVVDLPNMTLLPGLIDMHSHLLLHPYNETVWEDQVLKEPLALRVCRATQHAKATLLAGFTTLRDLGTEGAGYADVGIKQAINQGIIPGPRLFVTTRAIVATGSYAPRGFAAEVRVPQGAEEADADALVRVVRDQIGQGADWIKVYADYRWGPRGDARATFSENELKTIVETAKSSGRKVVAHASTKEGMRRATLAGVATIEHGNDGDEEVFRLMANRGVALCPTLAATEAIQRYRGWQPGTTPMPSSLAGQKTCFQVALASGVKICAGSDVGVFTHGTQARELELMVEYGMPAVEVLRSATSINAEMLDMGNKLGAVKPGHFADLIAVPGNPLEEIKNLRLVKWVMKNGVVVEK